MGGGVYSIFQLDFAGVKESQCGDLSTAAQKRAFGRDDKVWVGWKRANIGSLRCDARAWLFDVARGRDDKVGGGLSENKYGDISAAAQKRASGRDDKVGGGLSENKYGGFSTALRSGRNDSVGGGSRQQRLGGAEI
jgi:hypothetical protein